MPLNPSLFITGAGGYVGRRLCRELDPKLFHKIFCLSRKPLALPQQNMVCVEGDLLEPDTYDRQLASCDTVIHLAAATGKGSASGYFRVNAEGTRILTEACVTAKVRQLVHVSTIAVTFRDQTRYYYAHSKREAERIVAASGLCYTIARPTMVFGSGAPVLEGLRKLATAPVVPIFGTGLVKVQPIHVSDLARCLLALARREECHNETIEIGGPDAIGMEKLLIEIRRAGPSRGAPRILRLPLALVRPPLTVAEILLPGLLPLTVGQLASFANDSTSRPHPFVTERLSGMKNLSQMLESEVADE